MTIGAQLPLFCEFCIVGQPQLVADDNNKPILECAKCGSVFVIVGRRWRRRLTVIDGVDVLDSPPESENTTDSTDNADSPDREQQGDQE